MRRLLHGALAGALLSCMRAPLGLDWTQLAAVQATTAALFRAAALLAVALALDPARLALRTGPRSGWLAALCAGYAAHGLVLDVTPGSRAGYALWLLAGTLGLRALAGPRVHPGEPEPPAALAPAERAGLVLAGLGSACALEGLAREVRLFTLATAADEALVGSVFLALLAVGAAAFGPLLVRLGPERARFAAGLAASAGATLAGLSFLAGLTPDGLHGYLRRFDGLTAWVRALDARLGAPLGLTAIPTLDGASIGTLWTSAILAAAAWVGPGFVLGGTLGALRHAGRLRLALLGAAAGSILLPPLVRALGTPLGPEELDHRAFAWTLAALGTGMAALGAGLAAAAGAASARARLAGAALALALAALPWLRPRLVLWSFSPWAPRRVQPELVWPLPEGLLTLERARDGGRIVTLDRRRLTPLPEEEAADERRLRASWSLLPEEKRRATVRALVVGQLTPQRARTLAALGALELERTAPWHAALPALEQRLFADEPPPGRIVAPAEARARLGDGAYDWVVALPAWGPIVAWKSEAREIWAGADGPRLTDLELEPGVVGVAWLLGGARLERGTELAPLLVTVADLEQLSLGLVRGSPRPSSRATGPLFELSAPEVARPSRFLATMPQQRAYVLQAAAAASLACDGAPELARGLALHFGVQHLSSPYETKAQQIEVDEEALRAFAAALPAELDPLTREIWEALAWLFSEKRLPEQALAFLEPVAERFAPWPALDRAMGRAYREVLEPAEALRFLARARTSQPEDVGLWIESAACAEEAGDAPGALGHLEQALALPRRSPEEERTLGLALARLGDPRGRPLLARALQANPEDETVREALLRMGGQ